MVSLMICFWFGGSVVYSSLLMVMNLMADDWERCWIYILKLIRRSLAKRGSHDDPCHHINRHLPNLNQQTPITFIKTLLKSSTKPIASILLTTATQMTEVPNQEMAVWWPMTKVRGSLHIVSFPPRSEPIRVRRRSLIGGPLNCQNGAMLTGLCAVR
jgi:hypothetical protein